MSGAGRTGILLLAAGLFVASAAGSMAPDRPAGESTKSPAARRDARAGMPDTSPGVRRSVLERVIEQEHVETETSAPTGAWLGEVLNALARRLKRGMDRIGFGRLGALAHFVLWGLVAGVLVAGILAGLFLLRALADRRRSRRRTEDDVEFDAAAAARDPSSELAESIAAGRAERALALLWEVIARALAARGLSRSSLSRTNHELVGGARRRWPDWPAGRVLEELARDSDRLLYAGTPPRIDDVRRLVERARAVLP